MTALAGVVSRVGGATAVPEIENASPTATGPAAPGAIGVGLAVGPVDATVGGVVTPGAPLAVELTIRDGTGAAAIEGADTPMGGVDRFTVAAPMVALDVALAALKVSGDDVTAGAMPPPVRSPGPGPEGARVVIKGAADDVDAGVMAGAGAPDVVDVDVVCARAMPACTSSSPSVAAPVTALPKPDDNDSDFTWSS